ncbi:hypothetical protein [Erythrobacter sp.]|uniref:hypothetical protein n=1 Tax=Erythrobacter sp. TaxID=1042 RepID=UPI001425D8C4|nr:hypothetical protein [Erythrobacter sp.]QIQ85233.1 MAG: hypothetical protein G9473_03060 [Erythrobacter sp.]
MAFPTRTAAIATFTAALSLTAAPVTAAELPANLVRPAASGSALLPDFNSSRYDPQADTADWRRCWRRWGCRGWRGRGWRGRRGISAGDVLAGAVIIGGIAAIASAASNNRRERERDVVIVERDRVRYDDRYDDRRYDDRRVDDRRWDTRRADDRRGAVRRAGASGLENAVDMCLSEIERDVRVNEVDNVSRTARGWSVTGSLFDGSGFLCSIGNDGRVERVDYSGFSDGFRGSAAPTPRAPAGGEETYIPPMRSGGGDQWSDVRYLTARANIEEREGFGPQPDETMRVALVTSPADVEAAFAGERRAAPRGEPLVPLSASRQPAYPGGPIPGEEIPERRPIDGDLRR